MRGVLYLECPLSEVISKASFYEGCFYLECLLLEVISKTLECPLIIGGNK